MTSDERRAELERRGFSVARQPYLPSRWYMLRLQADGSRGSQKAADLDGWQYSVDLESGRWVLWGEGTWREWRQLVEGRESRVEGPSKSQLSTLNPGLSTFLQSAVQLGFELEPEEPGGVGNRWAVFECRRYLLCVSSRSMIGPGLVEHALAEFERRQPERPPMRERVPVETSGRNRQPALFG